MIWLFDSAIVLWACLTHGSSSLPCSSTGSSVNLTWTFSAAVDNWIEHGQGDLIIQGVGELGRLTPNDVLISSANSLDLMSWGLAARYKDVLLGLISHDA